MSLFLSGTEKQAVANDYTLQLDHGTATCNELATTALSKMISNGYPAPPLSTVMGYLLTCSSKKQNTVNFRQSLTANFC